MLYIGQSVLKTLGILMKLRLTHVCEKNSKINREKQHMMFTVIVYSSIFIIGTDSFSNLALDSPDEDDLPKIYHINS